MSAREGDVEGAWERTADPNAVPNEVDDEVQYWSDLDTALLYARERAPRVLLRVLTSSVTPLTFIGDGHAIFVNAPSGVQTQTFSVGDEWATASDAGADSPLTWPHKLPTPRSLHQHYGGIAYITADRRPQSLGELLGCSVRVESFVEAQLAHVEHRFFGGVSSLPGAISFARHAADYVVVTSGHPMWKYWSLRSSAPPTPELPVLEIHDLLSDRRDDPDLPVFTLGPHSDSGRVFDL